MKQIGWSQEANLLYQILKKIIYLNKVFSNKQGSGEKLLDEFQVDTGAIMEPGDTTYTDPLFVSDPPLVFADGIKFTTINTGGRYISYNPGTKTLTIHGGVFQDEIISIYA